MSAAVRFANNAATAPPPCRVPDARRSAWLLVILALCGGCGSEPPPAQVEGTLRVNGKPLDRCLITFLPEPDRGKAPPHATAVTDHQGRYRLRLPDQREGASLGWHRVTVQDLAVSTGVHRRDHGWIEAQQDRSKPPVRQSRVPALYGSSGDTPLRKEVHAGHQVMDLDIP